MIQSLFYFILFMVYKFNSDCGSSLEVEQFNTECIFKIEGDGSEQLYLTAKDVYHLIGALHLIQKEIKEVSNG